jgi:tetratricopeptide (TPR) repeat protein
MAMCNALPTTISRALLTAGIVLGVVASAWPQSSTTSTTIRHHKIAVEDPTHPVALTHAEAAIEQGDYTTAEPLLRSVVEKDPSNYQAWFDLGFLYNAQNKPDESIAAYKQSVHANPSVFESNLNLGLMLAKNNKPGAEDALRAATALKPTARVEEGQARAWRALGHLLVASQPDEALRAFQQAALLQPKDPEPHLSAGAIFEQQNKFSDAEQEYKQALAIDPGSSDALVGLANIYMRGARFPEAEEFVRKIVAQRPADVAPRVQLGRLLAADGKNDDAIAEFQAALKLAPADGTARLDLADVYMSAGKFADAEAAYRQLLATQPNDAQLHFSLGRALMKQKKFNDAQGEFLAAAKLKPDWGEAYGELAVAANENENYALTIRALDARAKFLAETPVTYFVRATAYDHLRDMKQAAANYHLFLQMAAGKYPDQEWQAQHRLIAIEPHKK